VGQQPWLSFTIGQA